MLKNIIIFKKYDKLLKKTKQKQTTLFLIFSFKKYKVNKNVICFFLILILNVSF